MSTDTDRESNQGVRIPDIPARAFDALQELLGSTNLGRTSVCVCFLEVEVEGWLNATFSEPPGT